MNSTELKHTDFKAIVTQSIEQRRHIHQTPELAWSEQDTTQLIRQTLDELNIPWDECTKTGTIGRLAPNASGLHIALRGDIDALPIDEKSGVNWQSQRTKCMHACGHDGHTAALLATARWLKLHESSLRGPVSLFFQPAEEGGHGAREMIKEGALKGIDEVYGWHNWPAIPYGQAVCPKGPVMSANGVFTIEVNGVGGHASQPEACADPILAASAIVLAVQQIVSRRVAPQSSAVVSITSFDAPSAKNVIRSKAVLAGGIRASITEQRDQLAVMLKDVAEKTAAAYGCTATVDNQIAYGATVNHEVQSQNFQDALAEEFGSQWECKDIPVPIMASEDFSYFLQEKPGAFALIGANDEPAHAHPCHSDAYDFNDKLIAHVVKLYSRLVGAPLP